MLTFNDQTEEKKLDELRAAEAEQLAQVLAKKYDLPYIDLSKFAINTDALRLVEESVARAARLACFKLTGRQLFIAALAPNAAAAQTVFDDLRNKNYLLNIYVGSEASLARAWERYAEISKATRTHAGVIDIASDDIIATMQEIKTIKDVARLVEEESGEAKIEGGISGLLEVILAGGISTGASDIHVEAEETKIRLRFRLDGVLKDISFFEDKLYRHLLARVKLVSGLKLNVEASAQDGRFSIKTASTEIEIRTSILPGAYGESIVLRLLNPETIGLKFEELGMEAKLLQVVAEQIAKPNGLILLTGPTGSGKTTTLYAFLRRINDPGTKIITIEDPIEYHLEGVNQTQVNRAKKYTFLSGLRSALRQDPDVIMIGEIRDDETAKIAVNASLTGHLVFSTLHTNNAAGTIPRLIDLEVNPKVLDASINIAMAQRLVRVLCPKCKKAGQPTAEEKELLEKISAKIKAKRPELDLPPSTQVWRPVGCVECHETGYRGRIGIFEAILMDQHIGPLLTTNPSEREIKRAAQAQGLLDMREDGVWKVLTGQTALEELGRVVDIHEEIL